MNINKGSITNKKEGGENNPSTPWLRSCWPCDLWTEKEGLVQLPGL